MKIVIINGSARKGNVLAAIDASYYATARDDLSKNMAALEELENIGSKIK